MLLRLLIIPPLLALAGLFTFGLLATFEPPGWPLLRLFYALSIATCLAGAGLTWFRTREVGTRG